MPAAQPSRPEQPEGPARPERPERPARPERSEGPERPNQREQAGQAEQPTRSEGPAQPEGPERPAQPEQPVPVTFRLPEGWRPVDPERAGASGVAFAALAPGPDDGFTANITADGEYRPDAAPLTDIAEESVRRLHEVAESVRVVDRREAGSPEAPALTQIVSFSAVTGGVRRDLVQAQVHLALLDEAEPGRRVVLRLVLTATPDGAGAVLDDFQEFVATVRPDTGSGA